MAAAATAADMPVCRTAEPGTEADGADLRPDTGKVVGATAILTAAVRGVGAIPIRIGVTRTTPITPTIRTTLISRSRGSG